MCILLSPLHNYYLKSLCETRWAARTDALFTCKSSFTSVIDTLDDLSTNYGDSKAGACKLAITQFGFIVTLVATEYMLAELAPLSKLLQNKECDLVEATKEARTIAKLVAEQRNDERLWDELYDKSVELAASVVVHPSKPRTVGRQKHRGNARLTPVLAIGGSTCFAIHSSSGLRAV